MNKFLLTAISAVTLGGLFSVQGQDGFVVWTEGAGCRRQMMFNEIKSGKLGPKKEVLPRQIADSWVNISYDGMWILFCRVETAFGGSYGECDYHNFDKWDVYVAKIDNGKILPATPIKVDHGYFPVWGMDENAKDPTKPKLLYYTRFGDQTIRKAVINPNGSIVSKDVLHSTCPVKMSGTNAHTQGSPDGKFILCRPAGIMLYSVEQKKDISGNLGGCHPAWDSRSKFFMRSVNGAFLNTGTSVTKLGKAFPFEQDYWQAFSNDSYYDKGKLWVIGKGTSPTGSSNVTNPIKFAEIDITNDGWKPGKVTDVGGIGVTADIHIFAPEETSTLPKISDSRSLVTSRIKTTISGLQLIIESDNLVGNSAELFNMQGEKIVSTVLSSSQSIIPLNTISNGKYILRVNNGKVSLQESILISR